MYCIILKAFYYGKKLCNNYYIINKNFPYKRPSRAVNGPDGGRAWDNIYYQIKIKII
jgi:hypothetical protein